MNFNILNKIDNKPSYIEYCGLEQDEGIILW